MIRYHSSYLAVVLAFSSVAVCSAGHPGTPGPIATTVATLAERPRTYAGKFVSVRSKVILGRGRLILTEGDYRILISEPGSSEVRKAPFDLIQDANWQKLNQAVAPYPPPAPRVSVIAVVEGRFDSKATSLWRKLLHIQTGYGHLGLYDHRIVIHRVNSVEIVAKLRVSDNRVKTGIVESGGDPAHWQPAFAPNFTATIASRNCFLAGRDNPFRLPRKLGNKRNRQ